MAARLKRISKALLFKIEQLLRSESNLHQQGSAVQIAGFTSDQNLKEKAGRKAGESLLVPDD